MWILGICGTCGREIVDIAAWQRKFGYGDQPDYPVCCCIGEQRQLLIGVKAHVQTDGIMDTQTYEALMNMIRLAAEQSERGEI